MKINSENIKKMFSSINKVGDTTPQLLSCKEDIKTFFDMMTDWLKGDYKHISRRSLAVVGVCMAYVISPIDIIPDFIPVVGKIDDISVIVFMLKQVKKELSPYRIWKAIQVNNVIDVD